MRISVELSMYPLSEEYISPIIEFIDSLKNSHDIIIRTNGMSTQLFGAYDDVMSVLQKTMKKTMESEPRVVFVAKFLNTDVSDFKAST